MNNIPLKRCIRRVLAPLGLIPLLAAGQAFAACEYGISNDWGAGYIGYVRVTNDGSAPIDGWQVSWEYTDGSTVANAWGGQVTGNNPYTASN